MFIGSPNVIVHSDLGTGEVSGIGETDCTIATHLLSATLITSVSLLSWNVSLWTLSASDHPSAVSNKSDSPEIMRI